MSADFTQDAFAGAYLLRQTSPRPLESANTELQSLSDEDLIALVKKGHNGPWAVLFTRYRSLVVSISLRILRDHCEAEDIAQDVFLEIRKHADGYDSARGSVKMWMLQYAYSRTLNRRRYLALRNQNNGNGSVAAPEGISDRHQIPVLLNGLTVMDCAALITNALEALSAKQREVIELVYFRGRLIKEAAVEMGEPVANVRHYYYRGLKRLRSLITGRVESENQL